MMKLQPKFATKGLNRKWPGFPKGFLHSCLLEEIRLPCLTGRIHKSYS